ncbi:MAG TPA: hypothetical protein DDW52_07135 [Planctomycetaceae bacterium]|nr:hypothetical protein [Planctomycetaceae bacterium]
MQILRLYRAAFSGLPSGVWAFSLVLLVHRSGTMVLPFLSLHLTDHLGISAPTAAGLISVYGIGSVLGAILGGRLVSRYGALRVMCCSMVGAGSLFLSLLFVQTAVTAAATMFVLAIVGDAVRPAGMTAVANLCNGQNLGRSFALTRLAVNLGMSIGPALAGLLYTDYFHLIFIINAVSCVLAAILVARLFGFRWMENEQPSLPATDSVPGDVDNSIWRDSSVLIVLAAFSCSMVVFVQTIGTYPIYLRENYGLAVETIGFLFTINTGLIVATEMILMHALESFSKLPLIAVGCALIATGFGIMPFGTSTAFICITVVIWTIGEMLAMPLLTTWISERASPEQRGNYMGLVTASFSLAWVVAPVLGGSMYRISPNAIWYFALAIGLVVTLMFVVVIHRENGPKISTQHS